MALFNKEPDKNLRTTEIPRPQPTTFATAAAQVVPDRPTPQPPPAPQPSVAPQPPAAPAIQARPNPMSAEGPRAYLDAGSKISGKLSFDGPIRIDGEVDGEIIGKDSVTIGESAVVTAQIKAASIIVAGKVSGDITAIQRIEIRPSAKVMGNLTSPVLVVHEGALFEGHCSMQPEAARDSKVTVFPKEERLAQAGGQKQA
jgi:cytoskeletal protein CcmA (bactofilin family)